MLLAPPVTLCHLPPGTVHPSFDAVMLFRISALTSWHATSPWDPEYFVHRVLSNMPLSADPRELLKVNGTVMICRTAVGQSALVVSRGNRVSEIAELFSALDVNRNGFLDRSELWRLQVLLTSWLTIGHDVAEQVSKLHRDAEGRIILTDFEAFWRAELHRDYHSFVVVNGSFDVPENADEAAFQSEHDYANYIPLGRIEAVGTEWAIPHAGSVTCACGVESLCYFFWDLLYTFVAAPGMCLLSHKALLKSGFVVNRNMSTCLGLMFLSLILVSVNPILYLCTFLYMSTEIGKVVTMFLLLSMEEFRRFLAHLEYKMDHQEGEEDDIAELSLAALQTDARLVRCPLCRRLSSTNQVVRKVHADIRRDSCCVCLGNPSEVCFGCGHLCMCSSCFDSLLEHRQPEPDDAEMVTVFGARSDE